MSKLDYKSAGVDIEAGDALVTDIKEAVESTFSSAVLSPLGGFAGLYDLKAIMHDYDNPVLVQSIDGVGTKSIVAGLANDFSTLGQDIVSATVNDILVCGAKPLTLLDYVASDRLRKESVHVLIKSIARACKTSGISLLGGETAEMPDTYLTGEHDVVGVVTGIVEKNKMIDGSKIQVGDKVIGLPSSGLHTNGYSLARKIFFEQAQLNVENHLDALGQTVGEALLRPHINYTAQVHALLEMGIEIHGMAHVSGGGIPGNLHRVLPPHCDAVIEKNAWTIPPVFQTMQALGNVDQSEMYRAFNMGIGYILVVKHRDVDKVVQILSQHNEKTVIIGEIVEGEKQVRLA